MHLFVSPYIYVLSLVLYIHPSPPKNDKLQAFFYFLALINFPLRMYLVVFSSGSQRWYGCFGDRLGGWQMGEVWMPCSLLVASGTWRISKDGALTRRSIWRERGSGWWSWLGVGGKKNPKGVGSELVGLKKGGWRFLGAMFVFLFQWIIIFFFGRGGGAFYLDIKLGTHFVWGGGQSKFLAAKCCER